jgi:tetratricopeptide (TPR) repeat protein
MGMRNLMPVSDDIFEDAKRSVDALDKMGEKVNALVDVFCIAQSMGRIDDLLVYCERFLKDPEWSKSRAFIRARLADICFEDGRVDKALEFYLSSTEFETDNDGLRHHRVAAAAVCCILKGDPLKALDLCKAAIVIDPERWQDWRSLGMCYEALDDPREAANSYARAIRLSEANTVPIIHLRELVKRRAEAIPHLNRIRNELSEKLGVLV